MQKMIYLGRIQTHRSVSGQLEWRYQEHSQWQRSCESIHRVSFTFFTSIFPNEVNQCPSHIFANNFLFFKNLFFLNFFLLFFTCRLSFRTTNPRCDADCRRSIMCFLRSGHHNDTLYCPSWEDDSCLVLLLKHAYWIWKRTQTELILSFPFFLVPITVPITMTHCTVLADKLEL